jgi:hypothetical protein
MIAQGASAFPCPSGDASCGNGAKTTLNKNAAKPKARSDSAPQNTLPDSNPNQKIEEAPAGEVDEGVTQDLENMNRQGGAHPVNRPK